MTHSNITIDIATGASRTSRRWKNRRWEWSQFVDRCRKVVVTGETHAEYMAMSREEQTNIKDVGGFVGGYLSDGVRKNGNVASRSCLTLDIDYGHAGVWQAVRDALDCAALLYSTHKHTDAAPRYRLVIPASRAMTVVENEAVGRRIAERIGIDLFDATTYEPARLFFFPSMPRDVPFVLLEQQGDALDIDRVLQTYTNPLDCSEWPIGSRESQVVRREMKKAGDPTAKAGIIGAFCRAYSIEEAIEHYLPDVYEATAKEGRYTYRAGSVAGGLVCYDHVFAFSHHESDPASRQLCNAFDLVRLHLYGDIDGGKNSDDVTRLPSYKRMMETAAGDDKVKRLVVRDGLEACKADFDGYSFTDEAAEDECIDALASKLTLKGKEVQSTIGNVTAILEGDPRLKGRIRYNDFSYCIEVVGGLPWDNNAREWRDCDSANLRLFLERNYNISGRDKIRDGVDIVAHNHRFHPIREYLDGLHWDGIPRLDRLIINYLGAQDTELNRAMTRKQFVGAVKRIYEPGCQHDYTLVLAGPEGAGKSSLLRVMGGAWFNDSLVISGDKSAMEELRKSWIFELAELVSIKRSDAETVKAFLSRREDRYRRAYGENTEGYPRQCVFFGTTNEEHVLRGDNGNRRFWMLTITPKLHTKDIARLGDERDQLWAEAVVRYREGEQNYLSAELEAEARKAQREYNEDSDDPLEGRLQYFLDMPLPADWETRPIQQRRNYCNSGESGVALSGRRTRFCVAEFLCECLGYNMSDYNYKTTARKVGRMMSEMPGWEKVSTTKHAKQYYGIQKGYKRAEAEEPEEPL